MMDGLVNASEKMLKTGAGCNNVPDKVIETVTEEAKKTSSKYNSPPSGVENKLKTDSQTESACKKEFNHFIQGNVEPVLPFVCGICDEKYSSMCTYMQHLKLHNSVSNLLQFCCRKTLKNLEECFRCSICSLSFPSMCSLYEHLIMIECVSEFLFKDRTAFSLDKDSFDNISHLIQQIRGFKCPENVGINSSENHVQVTYIQDKKRFKHVATQTEMSLSGNTISEMFKEVKTEISSTDEPYDEDTDTEYMYDNTEKSRELVLKENSDRDISRDIEDFNRIEKQVLQEDSSDILEAKNSKKKTGHVCKVCGIVFHKKNGLILHNRVHAKKGEHQADFVEELPRDIPEEKVKCPKCTEWFDSLAAFENHLSSHSDERKYECKICGQLYKTKSYLASHMHIHNERKIPCSYCLKLFKSNKSVKAHEKLQHTHPVVRPSDTICCEICGKEVKAQSIKSHLMIHEEPRFQCDICDRMFHTRADARKHMKAVHASSRDFICELCGADFKCANTLKVHSKDVHQSEYEHPCPKCDMVFKTKLRMKSHLKVVHSAERPFACNQCDKRFKRKSTLRVHYLCHSDRKLHKCSYCDKKFKLPADCKKHEKIHQPHSNFCAVCGKSFAFLYNLRCHEKLHISKSKEDV